MPVGRGARTRSLSYLFLLAGLLVAYNMNLRQVSSYDTYASRFVPISIVREGNLSVDEFFPRVSRSRTGHINDYLFRSGDRLFDSHPPVGPLLAAPVYALPVWLGVPRDPRTAANVLSKVAASLMAAFSAVLLFSIVRQLLERIGKPSTRVAAASALCFGLGTSVWSAASQALWSHTPALLLSTGSLWALLAGRWAAAGVLTAAAVLARPALVPLPLLVAVFGLHLWRRARAADPTGAGSAAAFARVVRFVGAGLAVAIVGAGYNVLVFGTPLGGEPFRSAHWVERLGASHMFSGSIAEGLAGLILSPSRGLLVFSPVVLIAALGAVAIWRVRLDRVGWRHGAQGVEAVLLMRYGSLAATAVLVLYSSYLVWWGGHGFGPRYLTDIMPLLGLLMGVGLSVVRLPSAGMTARVVTVGLFLYSVGIQGVGAFCWPSPWTLDSDAPYHERLWSWRNSQVVACIRSGPRIDPMAQRLWARFGP